MKLERAADTLGVPVAGALTPPGAPVPVVSPPSTPASSPLPKLRVLHTSTGQLRMWRVSISRGS